MTHTALPELQQLERRGGSGRSEHAATRGRGVGAKQYTAPISLDLKADRAHERQAVPVRDDSPAR